MERMLELIRGYVRLAWWDGCAVDLRLHRIADFVDFLAAAQEPRLMPEPIPDIRGEIA
jgi:virulence-associated protein VapD